MRWPLRHWKAARQRTGWTGAIWGLRVRISIIKTLGGLHEKNIDFFYRVSKEARLAEDDAGNPSDCYLKLGFTLKNPISAEKIEAERERAKDDALKAADEFLNIDVSLLTIVTEEEYLIETEEE